MNNLRKRYQITSSVFLNLFLFSIALAIWQIYYPGIMSPDSLNQYGQAYYGFLEDAHPPLMSISLQIVMKLGGGVGVLIFFQCLLALFGLRTLISLCLRFFSDNTISGFISNIIATGATILFLTPFLSPFMFFSVIFWKDAWLLIMLLWIAAYLLWIFLNSELFGKNSFLFHIILLSLTSSLTIVVRHNAIVVVPIICLAVAAFIKIKLDSNQLTGVGAVLPLFLVFAINPIVDSIFDIKRLHFGYTLLASDMKTLLKLYPELQEEYPLTKHHQNSPIILSVAEGVGIWDESTEGIECPVVECNNMPMACYGTRSNTSNINGLNCFMPSGRKNNMLKNEYINALNSHPVKFAHMKIYLYWQILHPRNWWDQKITYDIYQNTFGLQFNERFSGIRTKLKDISLITGNKWYFVWFSGVQILWLILNILAVIYFLIKLFIKRDRKSLITIILFLIPLTYYLSYILAAVAPDYRYMYPATLLMQIFITSILLSRFVMLIPRQNNI